ncbi:MAG: hypothetical protein ACK6D0_18995 [Planctomyces sp.]
MVNCQLFVVNGRAADGSPRVRVRVQQASRGRESAGAGAAGV